ncbi:MAG: ABC transporter substrate-binding protein, partial [Candidatus Limnocylindrales bacterium]
DEAQVNALGDGSVDFLDNFPPGLISALEGDPKITINRAPSTDFAELGFNSWDPTPERFAAEGCPDCPRGPTTGSMGNPWVTRGEVRAALAGLLDKQHLVEFALNGAGTPGLSLVSPLIPAFHYAPPEGDPVTFPAYADEAGRASARAAAQQRFRDAMAAIGFTDTDGNSILNVPDTAEAQAFDPSGAGQDWSLRLFVRQDDREDIRAGELIAQWFTEAGARTELRQVSEDPQLYDATYPSSSNADYDMYLWGWGPDPDPDFILSVFSCVQINNWQDANYCNAEYDAQYRATRTQVDAQARAQDIRDLQDFLYHDSPYSVLWYVDTLEAYRSDRWEGFNAMPRTGGALWSTYGMGPWGSRTTVGPIGAAGATPSPAPTDSPSAPPTASPTGAEPSPSDGSSPSPTAVVSTPPESIPPTPTAGPTAAPSPTPSGTGSGGTGGGDSTTIVVGGAVVVVAALAGVWWWRRRSLDEDDRD